MPFGASSRRFGKRETAGEWLSRCPNRLTDAFESRWLAGENTFEVWLGVVQDFPQADSIDLEYAAKFANRRIRA
jgi:hypothetical protein